MTTRKVYVLLDEFHHEGAGLEGVFESLELAQAHASAIAPWHYNAENRTWEAGHDAYPSGGFYSSWVIYECEVQVKR